MKRLVLSCLILLGGSFCMCCKGQSCMEGFMELSLLTHRAEQISGSSRSRTFLESEMRLLTDIVFKCPTIITNVLLGINVVFSTNNRNQYPSIILVREIDGNYTVLAEQTIYYTTENVSTNGVYNYSLNPPISVDIKDILGIRAPESSTAVVRVHYDTGTYNTVSLNDITNTNITDQLVLVYPYEDDGNICITNPINEAIIVEQALAINNVRSRSRKQIIYPELQFSCNGSITNWIFGARERDRELVQPEIQIWRQTGPDTYTKIGFSLVTANETASPNVYEHYPETMLEFQEGDVLGIHYPDSDLSEPTLYGQRANGPTNLRPQSPNNIDPPASFNLLISELQSTFANDFPLVSAVIELDMQYLSTTTDSTVMHTSDIIVTSYYDYSTTSHMHPTSSTTTTIATPSDIPMAMTNTVQAVLIVPMVAGAAGVILLLITIIVVLLLTTAVCIKRRKATTRSITKISMNMNQSYASLPVLNPSLHGANGYVDIQHTSQADSSLYESTEDMMTEIGTDANTAYSINLSSTSVNESTYAMPADGKESHYDVADDDKESHYDMPDDDNESHYDMPDDDQESHYDMPDDRESHYDMPDDIEESHYDTPIAPDTESHYTDMSGNYDWIERKEHNVYSYARTVRTKAIADEDAEYI